MTSQGVPQKRYNLLALAVLLLALACALFVTAPNSFMMRSLGLVAILVSVWLVRVSNVHSQASNGSKGDEETGSATGKRLGGVDWIVGVTSLLAAGAAYLYLRNDALTGYHQILPVYVFAGVGVVCMVVWGYLAVKLLR